MLSWTGHVTDADLIRIIDGTTEVPSLASHFADCSTCASRLAIMRSQLAHLAIMLREADVAIGASPAPRITLDVLKGRAAARRSHRAQVLTSVIAPAVPRRWLGAAAGVLLCAGAAAAAVPALRDWLAVRATHATTPAIPGSQPLSISGQSTGNGAVVSFHPQGDHFTIQFDAAPAGGGLELSTAAERGPASAEIVSGGAADELLVLPSELRIRNGTGSAADYRIALPITVHSLHVIFGAQRSARDTVIALSPNTHQEIHLGNK